MVNVYAISTIDTRCNVNDAITSHAEVTTMNFKSWSYSCITVVFITAWVRVDAKSCATVADRVDTQHRAGYGKTDRGIT